MIGSIGGFQWNNRRNSPAKVSPSITSEGVHRIIACAAGGRGDPCTQCESAKLRAARYFALRGRGSRRLGEGKNCGPGYAKIS
jgi:hypothetical protein